jgi:hypothetical protein
MKLFWYLMWFVTYAMAIIGLSVTYTRNWFFIWLIYVISMNWLMIKILFQIIDEK